MPSVRTNQQSHPQCVASCPKTGPTVGIALFAALTSAVSPLVIESATVTPSAQGNTMYTVAVVSLALIAHRLFGIRTALFTAIAASANPWFLFAIRSGTTTGLSVSLFLIGWAILLSRIPIVSLTAIIPLASAAYVSPMLAPPILAVYSAGAWQDPHRPTRRHVLLAFFVLAAACIAILITSRTYTRIASPNAAEIVAKVDAQRKNSVVSPLTPIISNKLTVFTTDSINRLYEPFDTEFLFISGKTRSAMPLFGGSLFHPVDLLLMAVGFVAIFMTQRTTWNMLMLTIAASTIPFALFRYEHQHPAVDAALLVPPLLLFTSKGCEALLTKMLAVLRLLTRQKNA